MTDTELEFKRLIVLADKRSLITEKKFILSLDAQPSNADNLELVASYQ